MDNGFVPPMTPDDFAALAAFAGPMYQESRTIESFTSNNPIPNAHDNYGSMNIKQGLEQAQRLAQASVARQQPIYVPPAVPLEPPDNVTEIYTPYIATITTAVPQPEPSNQLEFSFNINEQKISNDLLKEISKKLSKLITLLEKEDKIPKSKPNVKQNQV